MGFIEQNEPSFEQLACEKLKEAVRYQKYDRRAWSRWISRLLLTNDRSDILESIEWLRDNQSSLYCPKVESARQLYFKWDSIRSQMRRSGKASAKTSASLGNHLSRHFLMLKSVEWSVDPDTIKTFLVDADNKLRADELRLHNLLKSLRLSYEHDDAEIRLCRHALEFVTAQWSSIFRDWIEDVVRMSCRRRDWDILRHEWTIQGPWFLDWFVRNWNRDDARGIWQAAMELLKD